MFIELESQGAVLGRAILLAASVAIIAFEPAAAQVTSIQTTTGPGGAVTSIQTTTTAGPAATQAQAQAETAQIGVTTAAVTGSGISPTTTPGANAGYEEGSLLVASEAKIAGQYLTNSLMPNNRVLVFVGAGATAPDVSSWLYFQNETDRLIFNLKSHEQLLETLVSPPPKDGARLSLPLAAAAVLAVAPKILSYGYTSYQTAGVQLTPDDYMFGVALIQANNSWRLYTQQINATPPNEATEKLAGLDAEVVKSNNDILKGQAKLGELLTGKGGKIPANVALGNKITAAITYLTTDINNYTTFVTSLSSNSSAITWSSVMQAYAIQNALNGDGGVVFVKVHSAGAGVLTKSNLFTNFGAAPMYTSAGLVISYVYYTSQKSSKEVEDPNFDKTLDLLHTHTLLEPIPLSQSKAGIFEVMTPYHTIGTVRKELELDARGACKYDGQPKTGDAAKYCPVIYGNP